MSELDCKADSKTNGPSASGRILIVDSEQSICELLAYNLDNEGFDIDIAGTTDEAIANDLRRYRLIIIDAAVPGSLLGLDFVRSAKSDPETGHIPIVLCTALDSEEDIVAGLNAGADDYIPKPFSLRVMIARLRSILRRHTMGGIPITADTILTFGSMQADLVARAITIGGNPVALTRTEYDILVLFMRNVNRTFNRNEIYAAAWPPDAVVSERAIDTNISRIRKKIGAEIGAHIVNRSGFGYGLME